MEPSHQVWQELLKRAHALRSRYSGLRDGPLSTWSLVNRAAARFSESGAPDTWDRDRFFGVWTKAMCSVLNDLYRKQSRRADRGLGPSVSLDDEIQAPADADDEALRELDAVVQDLQLLDERKALVLTLRYFEQMTWQQIADALQTSVTSVRREWAFSMAWLRRELRQRGIDGVP
jgi:RNA polymerase sigma factor (TIGR02999 family)